MKKVITYGTFDLFHEGHYKLLERAKGLGDYLIVGVTSEHYDESRGKLNIIDSLMERIENVQRTGFADEIIIEDYKGQKLEDILKYQVDIFTIGSDWEGAFDYLRDYCEVVYLPRTRNISSSQLRCKNAQMIRFGVIGTGRISNRFVPEARYVSGANVDGVFNPHLDHARDYAEHHKLAFYTDKEEELYDKVDAIYIATPHGTHYEYVKHALEHGKHVLCEKPLVLKREQAEELYLMAKERGLVLMECLKTAHAPGFIRMLNLAKCGIIGNIKDVEACFTRLTSPDLREMTDIECGGSFTEFGSYNLLAIFKLLGMNYNDVQFEYFSAENTVDIYTKAYFKYDNCIATSKTGLGVKSEGQLLISGTKGYIKVEAPWWKTENYEVCYEDFKKNEKYFVKFLGDGLRYVVSDFMMTIYGHDKNGYKLTPEESIAMAELMEKFLQIRSTARSACDESHFSRKNVL